MKSTHWHWHSAWGLPCQLGKRSWREEASVKEKMYPGKARGPCLAGASAFSSPRSRWGPFGNGREESPGDAASKGLGTCRESGPLVTSRWRFSHVLE